jgi:hypothetical protein
MAFEILKVGTHKEITSDKVLSAKTGTFRLFVRTHVGHAEYLAMHPTGEVRRNAQAVVVAVTKDSVRLTMAATARALKRLTHNHLNGCPVLNEKQQNSD